MTLTHPPVAQHRRFHINPWLVAVIVLSAALAGVIVWALADREAATSAQTTTPLQTTATLDYQEVVALLADRQKAMNSADAVALAAFYAPDAILDDYQGGGSLAGADTIAGTIAGFTSDGLRLHGVADPIVMGRYVVVPTTMSVKGEPGEGTGANVLELNAKGQIVHEWMSEMHASD